MKNCLSRYVPEIHSHVAGMLSNQPTTVIYTNVLALQWSHSNEIHFGLFHEVSFGNPDSGSCVAAVYVCLLNL